LRTTSASNLRSSRVLAVDTVCSVLEYTILSAAGQIRANSSMAGDRSGIVSGVSQPAMVWYILRP
jgi:hypothetical protein